ncbi:MAG: M14 family zinc carboxypeptidase [Bacteroidota bacterium]
MKSISLFLLLSSFLIAQERYSQVEIPVRNSAEFNRLVDLGLAVDHYSGKVGTSISVLLSESELLLMDTHAIPYNVQIPDWQIFYNEQQARDIPSLYKMTDDVPKYFRYGAMGGFLIFDEIKQQLDSMTLLFPNLITKKDSIGVSIEGRTIYAIKISDNPNTAEANEPEVLYTSLHHAREPEGMMTVIYYMWWLLENYGKDAEATYIVNNRQLWFIPVVNPDGYEYNRSLSATGGGSWRKNRKNNGDGSYGVDLNRNYGIFEMWNANNNGSSTLSSSDTYRGVTPFSEPETQTISKFVKKHTFKTCFNYHTYGNYLVYPWGYNSVETNDSLLFRRWSYEMSVNNRYSIGTDMQTVGYSTRGNSDDFMFSDSAKTRTYAMTPEVGTTGFWPAKSLIYPLAQENILQNKYLAYAAGPFLALNSYSVSANNVNLQHTITLRFINKGLSASAPVNISLRSPSGIIQSSVSIPSINSFKEIESSVSYTAGSISAPMKIFVSDTLNGILNDSITFYAGVASVLFADSASTTSNWANGSWGISSDVIDDNPYFTDSPNGNYAVNSDNIMTLLSPISLSGFKFAELKFRTKWSIESVWDFGVIEVSTNGGTNWTNVRAQSSRKGSGRGGSKQPATEYGYDAFSPGASWIDQTADLSAYVGQQIKIRFRLSADGGDQRDGWYLDDIKILGYSAAPAGVTKTEIPFTYSLEQNYPNPFNPSTTIQFSVEKQSHSSLRIFNAIGQEAATLMDQELAPGNYSIKFDASLLSSGVYFYRFTSGNFVSIKKMTLIK